MSTPTIEAARAMSIELKQSLTDPENQPNQFGVEFLLHGEKFAFKIGNQQFTLDYEPSDVGDFGFMREMLIIAFSTFTHDVKTARTTIQQPATTEPVVDVRCEGCGYMTHHREHMGCVRAAKQHTRPAPSVPADVVRDAERYRFIRDADVSDDLIPDIALYAMESLDEYIDAAMLAAK